MTRLHRHRAAGYVAFRATALHAAAGALLAAEAGATVSDIDGQSWTISSDSIIAAANPGLHRELLGIARNPGARRRRSAPRSMR